MGLNRFTYFEETKRDKQTCESKKKKEIAVKVNKNNVYADVIIK